MDKHMKTNEYEANHLINFKRRSCEVDKHKRRCTTEDTEDDEFSDDEDVVLFDETLPSTSTSASNSSVVTKPYKENSTKYGEYIEKESEHVSMFRRVYDGVFWCLGSNQEAEEPQCNKQASVSGNLKRVDSNERHVTKENSNIPDINVVHDNNSQFLEATAIESDCDGHKMYEGDKVKTLEDVLRHFGVYSFLEMLDISLEYVRRHIITENVHEERFKKFDKEIQKLSLIYHPDKVRNRSGTGSRLTIAQKQQTALNAARTVLRCLNAAFLGDISTDHKFEFYSKLNISSLSNEREVKCRIYEMKFKLSMVSRIKQKNIILQIRKFLIESKKCVSHYIQDNKRQFKKSCNSVFTQLNQCIEGFKRLGEELEDMERKCKLKKDDNMLSFVKNMAIDNKRDLKLLYMLEKSAQSSMNGNYQFFCTDELIDPYFVRPLVWYINVILMCKVMAKSDSFWDKFKFPKFYYPTFNEFSELKPLYYLTAYYSGEKYYEDKVKKILKKQRSSQECFKMDTCKIEIISRFREILNDISKTVEITFNIDHYTEVMTADILALEVEKCISMMNEFAEKKQDLSEGIQEIRIKTEEMQEKYDDIMQTSKDMSSTFEKIGEENNKMKATLEAKSRKIEELFEASKILSRNSP